jgi:hypothetical protein
VAISPLINSYEEVFIGFERIRDYAASGKWQKLGDSAGKVT